MRELINMKQTRNNKQKEIIKNIITNADGHYSADEIYQMALKVDNNIGRATVFRNLKALAENDEIGYIQMIDGADCFESIKKPHYHFKCKKCNKLFDVDVTQMEDINKHISKHEVDSHVIIFTGTCDECLNKQ